MMCVVVKHIAVGAPVLLDFRVVGPVDSLSGIEEQSCECIGFVSSCLEMSVELSNLRTEVADICVLSIEPLYLTEYHPSEHFRCVR